MHSNDQALSNKGDTVPLQSARGLAEEDHDDWYIVLHEGDLHIAKLVAAGCLQFVRMVNDDGAELRFTSIRDAQEYLKSELSVSRTAVYLEDVPWES